MVKSCFVLFFFLFRLQSGPSISWALDEELSPITWTKSHEAGQLWPESQFLLDIWHELDEDTFEVGSIFILIRFVSQDGRTMNQNLPQFLRGYKIEKSKISIYTFNRLCKAGFDFSVLNKRQMRRILRFSAYFFFNRYINLYENTHPHTHTHKSLATSM